MVVKYLCSNRLVEAVTHSDGSFHCLPSEEGQQRISERTNEASQAAKDKTNSPAWKITIFVIGSVFVFIMIEAI